MKNLIAQSVLGFLCLFIINKASTQDVDIYYNLSNDEVTYFKNGEQLKNPKIKKGQSVKLHITEYNPYLYHLEVEVDQKSASYSMATPTGSGAGSFLSSMGMFDFTNGGGNLGGGVPSLDIPVLKINDNPITLKGLFKKSRGSAVIMQNANLLMVEIEVLIQDVERTYSEIKAINKAAFVSKLAMVNLQEIKTHPNLKPSLIHEISSQYYKAVFNPESVESISIDDLFRWNDMQSIYQSCLARLDQNKNDLSKRTSILQMYGDQLSTMNVEDEMYDEYVTDLGGFVNEAQSFGNDFNKVFDKIPESIEYPEIGEISKLQLELAEMVSNDFTYHTRFQPLEDEIVLSIELTPKADSLKPANDQVILNRSLQLDAKGGLKINASVGLGFSQFLNAEEKYSTKDGVIVAESSGDFNPSLASYLHFYSYSGKKVNIGGTLGLGFPIFNNQDNFTLQFYLGPSIILGSAQRLVLSGGAMGGKVNRLSKGYSVGDPFDANQGDIPTSGNYEFGWFAGLSFNISG